MIETNESGVRVIEVYNALATVLPLYDPESRKMYEGIFNADIAELIPLFFMQIARTSIKDPDNFTKYMNFLFESIRYIRGDRKTMPLSADYPDYFIQAREKAEKMLSAWNVKVTDTK